MTLAPALRRTAVAGLAWGVLGTGAVAAQTKVFPFPGDPSWTPWTSAGGTAVITGANPRRGNGSLALSTGGDLFDWGFYRTLSGPDPWGRLGDISALSFEWFRTELPFTTPPQPWFGSWPDAPWLAQTPVLRLLLGQPSENGLVLSELVWERWYTDPSAAPVNQWVEENLLPQSFWRNVGGTQYSVSDCSLDAPEIVTPPPAWELLLGSPLGWATGSFVNSTASTACAGFNLGDASVFGIAVGVGSNWPDQYQGNVDFVRLAFNGEDAVFANFELPETTVPEPATLLLLGSGLAGLGAARWARRKHGR